MSHRAKVGAGLGFVVLLWAAGPAEGAQKVGKKPPKPKPAAEAPAPVQAPPPADGAGADPAVPPPAAAGLDHGPSDGFGHDAKGGSGPEKSVPASASAIAAAVRGGGVVKVAAGDVDAPFNSIKLGSNTTLDGGGCTLWFPGNNHNGTGVLLSGDSIVVRNLRVRNGGDNLSLGSSSSSPAGSVLIEHVTSSASGDDGYSVSYKAHDMTIRWSAALGCTRAIFFKYGGTRLSMHHNIVSHFWIRGPLCSGSEATIDFRNNLVQFWSMSGSTCESGSKGNYVNNAWRTEPWAKGEAKNALQSFGGSIYQAGNLFLNNTKTNGGGFVTDRPVVEAPPINQLDEAQAAMDKVLSDETGAGCMPRDVVDKAYLAYKQFWQAAPSNKSYPVGLQIPETQSHLKGGGH